MLAKYQHDSKGNEHVLTSQCWREREQQKNSEWAQPIRHNSIWELIKQRSSSIVQVLKPNAKEYNTCSSVCWARSVVDIITPAAKEPSSRLKPSLSLHWNDTKSYIHTCKQANIDGYVGANMRGAGLQMLVHQTFPVGRI